MAGTEGFEPSHSARGKLFVAMLRDRMKFIVNLP